MKAEKEPQISQEKNSEETYQKIKLQKSQIDALAREIRKPIKKYFEEHLKSVKKQEKSINAASEMISSDLSLFRERVELLEETLLIIYANIKRNQFLYSHFPEEWDQTYLSFKEQIKAENEELGG